MKKGLAITIISVLAIAAVLFGVLYFTNNSQKTKEIEGLRSESAEKSTWIEQLNSDIEEKKNEIEALSADVAEKVANIDILNADVSDKANRIEELNSDVETKKNEIEALSADVAEKTASIDALNADITERTKQIETLTDNLNARDERIVALNEDKEELNGKLEELNTAIAGQLMQIELLTAENGEKDNQVNILASALEEKGRQIEAYIDDVNTKEIEITELTEKLENTITAAQKQLEDTITTMAYEAEIEKEKAIADAVSAANVKAEAEKAKAVEEAVAAARKEAEDEKITMVEEASTAAKEGFDKALVDTGITLEETEIGFGGPVTVKVILDGKTVKALTIDTQDETPGMGQRASEEAFTSQFIGKEGPFTYGEDGVDVLTGATVTSEAVLKALNEMFDTEKAEEIDQKDYDSYMVTRETPFSIIRVHIKAVGEKITDCQINSVAKMAGSDFLTDEIKKDWAKAIAINGTAEIDAITGATLGLSSEAVVDAVDEILGLMTKKEPEPKEEGIMSHADYIAAEIDSEVVIETSVQATQNWWSKDGIGKATVYAQSEDGAYFIYEMNCSEEDAKDLIPGTRIKVKGYKSEWSGEVEIVDATFEFVDGKGFIAKPFDVTSLIGTEELIKHQNELVSFKGLTVLAQNNGRGFQYKWNDSGNRGDDLYFNVFVNGKSYPFVVESYLCGPETEVYTAVEGLKAGDVIDAEGFLYWYEGLQPHIINITHVN